MKLNAKGNTLFDAWEKIYRAENDKLGGNSAEGHYVEGWCIIDNNDHVKTLDDVCGLMVFGYDDCALSICDKWGSDWGENEPIWCGYTVAEIRAELLQYFEEA